MTQEEKNTATLRSVIAAADAGDREAAVAFFADDYVDHDAGEIRQSGVSDRDGARRAFQALLEAFPDTRHTIHDVVAQGNRVAARISAEGTHACPLQGVSPSGRRIATESIVIYRFEDGKIAERWLPQGKSVLEQVKQLEEGAS